ncbi:hypothetical protein XELAEV_180022141mg, partial [Xenopus laevis]
TRIPIKGFYTCESTYVVYSIKCPCGKTYVGKTIVSVRNRLTEHNGLTISQLPFQVLDSVSEMRRGGGGGDREILRREAQWIRCAEDPPALSSLHCRTGTNQQLAGPDRELKPVCACVTAGL